MCERAIYPARRCRMVTERPGVERRGSGAPVQVAHRKAIGRQWLAGLIVPFRLVDMFGGATRFRCARWSRLFLRARHVDAAFSDNALRFAEHFTTRKLEAFFYGREHLPAVLRAEVIPVAGTIAS